MKKAFTLIELLVVIAIIAILAAILFPVFAQARVAAKKTAAISNQKQISLGFMMYLSDNEDRYPMRAGCEAGSSLNPALNVGAVVRCNAAAGFAHSMTWQSWQKYIYPYVKNIDLFRHPLRQSSQSEWNQHGQILNSFVMNLGLTGAAVESGSGFITTPWTGGNQGGLPNPSAAMLLMEMPNSYAIPQVVPQVTSSTSPVAQTGYTMAIREYWEKIFYKTTGGNNCTNSTPLTIEKVAAPAGGVVCGMADGSAKFITVERFLGLTPRNNEYLTQAFPAGSAFASNCRVATNAYLLPVGSVPNTSINYPFWGLGQ